MSVVVLVMMTSVSTSFRQEAPRVQVRNQNINLGGLVAADGARQAWSFEDTLDNSEESSRSSNSRRQRLIKAQIPTDARVSGVAIVLSR